MGALCYIYASTPDFGGPDLISRVSPCSWMFRCTWVVPLTTSTNNLFINNRAKRSLLSQFRFGILPLRIETGRWYQGVDINQRLCEICKSTPNTRSHTIEIVWRCSESGYRDRGNARHWALNSVVRLSRIGWLQMLAHDWLTASQK